MRGVNRRFFLMVMVILVIPSLMILPRETTHSLQSTNNFTEHLIIDSTGVKSASRGSPRVHLLFLQSSKKPVITNVQTTGISTTSATITWDTDISSDSKVNYGLSKGTFNNSITDPTLVTSHSVPLTGLAPATTYYYEVQSSRSAGRRATDNNNGNYYMFTTLIPPAISTKLHFTSTGGSTEVGTVEIDRIHTTRVKYIEDGGNPINGAQINIIDSEGAGSKAILAEGAGIYRIKLTPAKLGHFTLQIKASKAGFDSASVTLILDIVPIETDLYFVSNYQVKELAPVQINETYTTLVQFNRTSTTPETPIDDATLNVVPSDPGIIKNITVAPLGNGCYQIAVIVDQSAQVSIVIEASKAQYEGDSVTLVLISGLVETQLRFLSTSKSTETGTVQVYNTYITLVQFNATVVYPELPIDEGMIEVRSSSLDLGYTVTPLGNSTGTYQIELEPTTTGQINIDLEASAGPSYLNAYASLTLIVDPIPTMLKHSDPKIIDNQLSLIYLEPIEIAAHYTDESGGMECELFEYETNGLVFQDYREGEAVGEYIFSFKAPVPSTYQVILTLYKKNYAPARLTIVIVVNPIPMVNIQDTVVVITEKNPKKLTIELRNEVDDSPVIGANVTYVWEEGSGIMEDLGNGIYVADLSREKLNNGSYTFEIIAEKANHAQLVVEYSLIIQEPMSFLRKNWIGLSVLGCLVIGGTTPFILNEHKKRRARTLLEARKRVTVEYITDITHFLNLLVITPGGMPFYNYSGSISHFNKELDPSLYSSFLIAVQNLAGISLPHEGSLSRENHFRFSGTELFLHSIREFFFVYMFSAQIRNGDWKKINQSVLERCKELTIRIEHDFQDAIINFDTMSETSVIPHLKILDVITETLALDFVLPHRIINLEAHREVGFLDESAILQTIEQLSMEEGQISLFQVLEQLEVTEIPPNDIVFEFHQLREEGVITPVTRRERSEESPSTGKPEDTDREIEFEKTELNPEKRLKETKIISLDPEKTLSLLKKLQSRVDTPSEEKSKETPSFLKKMLTRVVIPLKEKSKETLSFLKKMLTRVVIPLKEKSRETLSLLKKLQSRVVTPSEEKNRDSE